MQAVIDAYVVLPGKGDPLPLTMARKKRYVQLVSTCMEEDAGAPPAEFKAAFAHFPAEVQEELQSIEDEMKPPLVAWWRLVGSTAAELALKQKREAAKREAAELKKRNTQSLKPAEEDATIDLEDRIFSEYWKEAVEGSLPAEWENMII